MKPVSGMIWKVHINVFIYLFYIDIVFALFLCCKMPTMHTFVVEGKYTFPVFTVKFGFNPNIKQTLEKHFSPLRGIICSLHLHEAVVSWAPVYLGLKDVQLWLMVSSLPLPLPPEEKSTVLWAGLWGKTPSPSILRLLFVLLSNII